MNTRAIPSDMVEAAERQIIDAIEDQFDIHALEPEDWAELASAINVALASVAPKAIPSSEMVEALRGLLDAVDTLHETQSRIVVDPHAVEAARAALTAIGDAASLQAPAVVGGVKLVRQKQQFGCTVATLAMILGISYDEAAPLLASDTSVFDTSGHGYHVLESQLVQHGYAISRKWRVFQPGNQARVPWPCEPFADIHWCEVISGGRGHAVVMLRDGTVLDPMSDEPKRLSDYGEVNFVAAVIPVPSSPEMERGE